MGPTRAGQVGDSLEPHFTATRPMITLRSVATSLHFLPGLLSQAVRQGLALCCFALAFAPPARAQVPGTLLHSIPAPPVGVQAGARLGISVAAEGGFTVVGAPFDFAGGAVAGVVKVFDSATGALLFVIPNPSPSPGDRFGISVAISGTRVVVGADFDDTGASNAGSAYVYDLSSGTPTVPVATLNNPGPAVDDNFGYSVAISGTRVVVGALLDDTGANDAGSAYVYDLSSGTPTVPVVTLNNPSPAADDRFGISVAISGMRVVVGAYLDNTGAFRAGSAYVYDLSSGTPTVPVTTLNNPGPASEDFFGLSVAISGTRVVVGAYQDDTGASDAGSAYVYDLTSGTPTVPVATLNNPGPAVSDNFGVSVAISGTRVVVGAWQDDTGASDAGNAYVYDLSSGTPTVPVVTLNNLSLGGSFGTSVAISATLMVVGASQDDTGATNAGSAYVYDLSSGTPTVPVATLNNPSPAASDGFGGSVAISGTRVVVGAPYDDTGASAAGITYVYDLSSGTPTVPVAMLNNPDPINFREFGLSVAISGTRVVVGAPDEDAGRNFVGVAYVYDLNSGTPTVPVATLNNPRPADFGIFGFSVAIDGTRVVVGTPLDDTAGADAGSAYVYDLSSGTPTVPVATLNNPAPGPALQAAFGFAVAISSTRVVVGAYYDDTGASEAGSAYGYDLSSGTPTVPVATLNNPGPAILDRFGYSVAIDGTTIAVGTPFDDSTAADKGAAYVFGIPAGPTGPTADVVIATDGTATGAGLPTGTKFTSFTAPDVGVFGGKVSTPAGQKLDAVFTEAGTVLLRGQQMVAVEAGPSPNMGMIAKLKPPTGDAVLATLDRRSGATAADDQVLFVGLKDSDPEPMVRKGQEIPGLPGVKLKSFLTLDGNGDTTFFSGKLSGAGVNAGNNTAIFAAGTATGFKMMVRKGQMVGGKQVKIIATLVGTAGTLAEGRWRGGPDSMGMRLTFTDRTQGLYLIRASDVGPDDWLLLGQTGGDAGTSLPGAKLQSFNLPAYAPDATVFDSLLQIGMGGITKRDNGAIFDAMGVETRGPISLRVLAQRARPVPAEPTTGLQRFTATLAGLGRASTFVGRSTRTGTRGVAPAIYDSGANGTHRLLARVGDQAPGGGRWNRFTSVAKPDGTGYGALVSALLAVSRSEGVTPATRAALYGVDSTGSMRRLLRAGDSIESAGPGSAQKAVKSFAALGAASGSIGAARGYDANGRVNVLVTFADRTQAVLSIQVP